MTAREGALAGLVLLGLLSAGCDGGDDPADERVDARPADAADPDATGGLDAMVAADAGGPDAMVDSMAEDLADAMADGAIVVEPPDAGADAALPGVLSVSAPAEAIVDERQRLRLVVRLGGPAGARLFALDRPPGARWSERERALVFTPDWIQGGRRWTVKFVAVHGEQRVEAETVIEVRDTIAPPPPAVEGVSALGAYERVDLRQPAHDWLDPDGRTYGALVFRPVAVPPGERRPVRIRLHGFNGPPPGDGWEGEYRIGPHDQANTYWYGRRGPRGLEPYTQRRILHLLEWVLDTHPGADPERVYVDGPSMGGAGAKTLGLMHARHIAWVEATIGQAIPRNHRPSRIRQLTPLWGEPGPEWDVPDLTRVLRDDATARDQRIFLKHGKDDPLIHFGAMVHASPLTGSSFYDALQAHRVGHLAIWDEGGHGVPDPVLPDGWWQRGWNPIFDVAALVRRDRAHPAFTGSSADGDPGDGSGNGRVPWNDESGFSADVNRPGDTGWSGDRAGALNRGLRWDGRALVDEIDRFEMPLMALDTDTANPPPAEGYPVTGDTTGRPLPVTVDVTPRRVQRFVARAGEPIGWTFGAQSGVAEAADDGSITVPGLRLTAEWRTLVLERRDWPDGR